MTIEYRVLRTVDEVADMPALEAKVWGGSEVVAAHMLIATIHEGGVAIGAFDDGRLVGSVYGFSTHEAHVLHSHYLAVDPDYRGAGIGQALKHQQRAWCLDNGRTAMRWTFDPLQTKNGHLNLNGLGAVGERYTENVYGVLGGINGDLPSDRLTVTWYLNGRPPVTDQTMRVAVPRLNPELIESGHPDAMAARIGLRRSLVDALAAGWVVIGFDRADSEYHLGQFQSST